MVDLYRNQEVGPKADVWALGCILFALAYGDHPFADESSLQILNAQFRIPSGSAHSPRMQKLVTAMLTPDPALRPPAKDVLEATRRLLAAERQAPAHATGAGVPPAATPVRSTRNSASAADDDPNAPIRIPSGGFQVTPSSRAAASTPGGMTPGATPSAGATPGVRVAAAPPNTPACGVPPNACADNFASFAADFDEASFGAFPEPSPAAGGAPANGSLAGSSSGGGGGDGVRVCLQVSAAKASVGDAGSHVCVALSFSGVDGSGSGQASGATTGVQGSVWAASFDDEDDEPSSPPKQRQQQGSSSSIGGDGSGGGGAQPFQADFEEEEEDDEFGDFSCGTPSCRSSVGDSEASAEVQPAPEPPPARISPQQLKQRERSISFTDFSGAGPPADVSDDPVAVEEEDEADDEFGSFSSAAPPSFQTVPPPTADDKSHRPFQMDMD